MTATHYQETFVNGDKNALFGKGDPIPLDGMTPGQLYRFLTREYGRCVSKVYRDTDKGTMAVGWVFESRQQYGDAHRWRGCPYDTQVEHKASCTYIQSVWVELLEVTERPVMLPHFDPVAVG